MIPPSQSERFQAGVRTRREVLGDEHVDRATEAVTELSAPLHELLTEYGWGAVWSRDGLDRRSRSLVTVAMLTALNRPQELRAHLLGALNNGCSRVEIREVLLQSAIYCGVPASIDAFRVADQVLGDSPSAT
jgi:4-carboxymuconolactone decarboxylase